MLHARKALRLIPFLALTLVACGGSFGGSPRGPADGDSQDDEHGAPAPSKQDPVTGRITPSEPEFVPVAPLLRRLTRDELRNTLEDTLGVRPNDADMALVPVDRPLEGFVNIASAQSTLPEHVLAYSELATHIAQRVDWNTLLSTYAPCRDAQPSCVQGFVGGLGKRLFRRPLEEREARDFSGLFEAVRKDGGSFIEGASAVTRAMLQSPQFLYLIEVERDANFDGLRAVRGYEMASRISYYLWQTTPDTALLNAAEAFELDDRNAVSRQVERMLKDKSRRAGTTQRFLVDWARLENLPDDDGLRAELVETAIAFYQYFAWESGAPFSELFTVNEVFLTPALAKGYGVSSQGEGTRRYSLEGLDRAGLLSQPGVIAGMTNADGGEIVARGLFQLAQLFCGDVPNPPASLQEQIEGFVASLPPGASAREVAEARLDRPECSACHAGFDPLAYALSPFDARGRYRERDALGNPLESDGWIPKALTDKGSDLTYANFRDFAGALSQNERVTRCLVQKNVEHALGRRLSASHAPSVDLLIRRLAQTQRSIPELVATIVSDDLFRAVPIE